MGGLESVVTALARGQQTRGHEVTVAATARAGSHPFIDGLGEAGIPVIRVPESYLIESNRLAGLARDLSPAVVHSHGYRSDVMARVVRRSGQPIVSTVHGFTGGGWKNRLYERIQRRALARFDAVIAVSHPLARFLEESGVPRDRIRVVPNAPPREPPPVPRGEARRRLGLPEGAVVLGWVGRLSQEKGADVLLEALGALRDREWLCCIIGEGRERRALEELAKEWGVAERVRFTGAIPGAGAFYGAFDVFVMSSRAEGSPMVLLEAMASGVPAVVTAVGGVPETVGPSEAWLVPPERPDLLAAAIGDAVDRPDERRNRAARSSARLEREFGVRRWLDSYDDIYRGVCR
ncbi:MAG: glycosyltransferase [Gemmatimonadales bacterium]